MHSVHQKSSSPSSEDHSSAIHVIIMHLCIFILVQTEQKLIIRYAILRFHRSLRGHAERLFRCGLLWVLWWHGALLACCRLRERRIRGTPEIPRWTAAVIPAVVLLPATASSWLVGVLEPVALPIPLYCHQCENNPREHREEGERNGGSRVVRLVRIHDTRTTPLVREETETHKPEEGPDSGESEISGL